MYHTDVKPDGTDRIVLHLPDGTRIGVRLIPDAKGRSRRVVIEAPPAVQIGRERLFAEEAEALGVRRWAQKG